jgi:glycosyltransferase involved in cell wall biosynthesis
LDDLGHFLAGRGHEVDVVTGTNGPARIEHRDDAVTLRYVRHLRPGPGARMGLSEVETFGLRALGPLLTRRHDVVHAFTPSGALAGRVALRPTVYTVLGHPDREQLPASRALRRLFEAAIATATATAVLSRASASALARTFGREAVVLPPGVRQERFSPDLRPRTGPPRLLFSASLADRRKRVDLAVETLALVLARHPDARLALSGEGEASWALQVASRAGEHVRAAIDVLGPGEPEEVPGRYRSASVTLLPAEHEAFGLALLESLASGTPAVCAPAGGMPEIIADAGVGAVATASTAPALAEAVETSLKLGGQSGTAARCVERARKWSWEEAVGPAHERLYAQMASRAPRLDPGFAPDRTCGPRDADVSARTAGLSVQRFAHGTSPVS